MAYMVSWPHETPPLTSCFLLDGNDLGLFPNRICLYCRGNNLVRLFGCDPILVSNEIRFYVLLRRSLCHITGSDRLWHCLCLHLFQSKERRIYLLQRGRFAS